jgi:hypothetical protein
MRSSVFIIGIEHRSGINFLSNVIRLHPDFQLPAPLWEDYLLRHSGHLFTYVERTSERWKRWVEDRQEYQVCLLKSLGDGLLGFLGSKISPEKRIIVKTPVAHNLENFSLLFPQGKMLILIRDGRDVVQSAQKTWKDKSALFWIRRWNAGAQMIHSFTENAGRELRDRSWKLVRYEDLVENPKPVVEEILDFVAADRASFQWDQLEKLPLRGSSVNQGGKEAVHWDPVEKPKDFQPIGRWAGWSAWKKLQFKFFAGKELIRLGYAQDYNW